MFTLTSAHNHEYGRQNAYQDDFSERYSSESSGGEEEDGELEEYESESDSESNSGEDYEEESLTKSLQKLTSS